jgi:hypothetical protein
MVRLAENPIQTAKIGSLADVNDSQDAEGLRVFYYLVQDLKVGLGDHAPRCSCGGVPRDLITLSVFHFLSHHLALQDQAQ